MKVGFASRWDPQDKRAWSGTVHYTFQQVAKYFDTETYHYKWPWRVREWLTMQKSLNRKLFGRQTSVEFLRSYAKYFSRQLEKDLKQRPVDVLFVPASSQLIAFAETKIPVVYMTDATFQQLQGYYTGFSNLPAYNIRQGIALDKKAFRRAAHCMLASDWCREAAMNGYGIAANKISVAPCGANLDNIPPEGRSGMKTGTFNLLFLGVEWERKGGEIVLETFRILKKKGLDIALQIIGCVPPHDLTGENIQVIPFLDKNKDADMQQLEQVFAKTDALFLPTRAECAGVVFSESSAFGIPSITTDTGGVSTYVKNDINGYALPHVAGAMEYADRIQDLYDNPEKMNVLRLGSRRYFLEKLSWDRWGEAFKKIAESLATGGSQG